MSEREAKRLGVTERPREDPVKWTNPRTGRTIEVDRGLDPSWAGNPGRDRPRMLAEIQAAGIASLAALAPAAAREAIRQVVDSPQLERQFAPLKPGETLGDLPIALLPPKRARQLGTDARALVLTRDTAKKQAKKHHKPNEKWPDSVPLTVDDYRILLPEILERAKDEHVVRSGGHLGADRDELLLAYEKGDLWYLLAIGRDRAAGARPRLLTFYNLSRVDAMQKLVEARHRAAGRASRDE